MGDERVIHTKSGVKVVMDGYRMNGDDYVDAVVAKIKDTGNGYICKFPTFGSTIQTNYVCLDYAEAEYIRFALNAIHEKEQQK